MLNERSMVSHYGEFLTVDTVSEGLLITFKRPHTPPCGSARSAARGMARLPPPASASTTTAPPSQERRGR
eukprot:1864812-Pyramimonas_sp.AAC.1